MRVSLVLAISISLLTLLFAAQNSAFITVRLVFWVFEASLALVVVVTLGLGLMVGLLVSLPATLRRGWTSSQRKRTIQELEKELQEQMQLITDQKRRIEFLEKNLPQRADTDI